MGGVRAPETGEWAEPWLESRGEQERGVLLPGGVEGAHGEGGSLSVHVGGEGAHRGGQPDGRVFGRDEQVRLPEVPAIGGVLDHQFGAGLIGEVEELARARGEIVGSREFGAVASRDFGETEWVFARAHGGRATVLGVRRGEEATDRIRAARGSRKDDAELARNDAALEVAV